MIVGYETLPSLKQTLRGTVVYVRGAFDILHSGHAEFIDFARQEGDHLVVGVISDVAVRQSKGSGRPVRGEADRVRLVDALKEVDYTFVVPSPVSGKSSTEQVLEALGPGVFVLFDEVEAYTSHFQTLMQQHGVRLVLDRARKRSSSTALIQKMRAANP